MFKVLKGHFCWKVQQEAGNVKSGTQKKERDALMQNDYKSLECKNLGHPRWSSR